MRFLGAFPIRRSDVPDTVVAYLSNQLACAETIDLDRYLDPTSRTYKRHIAVIRTILGFRDLHSTPTAIFGLSRKVYALFWAGEDRPGHLVQWASDWLVENKVVLPGLSTLERFVGHIRERARQHLWHRMVTGLSEAQKAQIAALFVENTESFGNLEILRARPLKRRPTDFAIHLDRLDGVRSFGLSPTPPKGVPAVHLERLARVARSAKPSAIAALKEPRRTATVAALFYTLEASAQDDAAELGEALVADLFRAAEMAQLAHRKSQQKKLDEAVRILRSLAGMVIAEGDLPLDAWKDALFAHLPKDRIEAAIETVDCFVQPGASKPLAELKRHWIRARKLFFKITKRIDLAAAPGGQAVIEAMDWLRDQPDWSKAAMKGAPTAVVSKSWQPFVLDADGKIVDSKASLLQNPPRLMILSR